MTTPPLKVLVVSWAWEPVAEPAALLEKYADLPGLAGGLASTGSQVTVLQRFSRDVDWHDGGIHWRFAVDGPPGRPEPRARLHRFHRLAALAEPDVVHAHGMPFYPQLAALRKALPAKTALLAQHHAGGPVGRPWRWFQARVLGKLDGVMFAATALGEQWRVAGALPRHVPIHEVMEGSCRFRPLPRQEARAETGLTGEPALLWVGRLDANKDPLTVIDGLAPLLRARPEARFYLIYNQTRMLADVECRLAAEPGLARQIMLLGERPRAALEAVYGSCHYYVSGSHSEGSGYALAEALACGVVPIVTDIPSFRMMTDGGRLGGLWEPGDAAALTATAERVLAADHAPLSAAAREFFEARLSWDAIGREAVAAYRQALARRSSR